MIGARFKKNKESRGFIWVVAVAVGAALIFGAFDDDDDDGRANVQAKGAMQAQLNALNARRALNPGFTEPSVFQPNLTPHEYLDQIFSNSDNPMAKLYLPNYAYTQSLVYANDDVNIFGQVRVLGGVVSKDRTQLGYGAMVTAVPEYITKRTAPTQNRYHITEWKEKN